MKSLETITEDLINSIDLKKIHNHMKEVAWVYWDSRYTPTIEKLKSTAASVIQTVFDSDEEVTFAQCGGFTAIKCGDEYELLFALSNSITNVEHDSGL